MLIHPPVKEEEDGSRRKEDRQHDQQLAAVSWTGKTPHKPKAYFRQLVVPVGSVLGI
jgi:hypothetical protein